MSVTIEPSQETLDRTREAAHPRCLICGQAGACSLGLQFRLCEDGSVEARFACRQGLQGYTGVLHGGITSSLLDGAMTNCLFAHGIVAVTGRMTVRFRHPIKIGVELVVRAKIVKSHGPIHALESQVIQQGIVMAAAAAKFMEQLERNQ